MERFHYYHDHVSAIRGAIKKYMSNKTHALTGSRMDEESSQMRASQELTQTPKEPALWPALPPRSSLQGTRDELFTVGTGLFIGQ